MKKNKKNKLKELIEGIALARIERLFQLASEEFGKHPERSKRYVQLARAISRRNKVSLEGKFKMQFCKKCGAFLKAGKNARKRIHKGYASILCLECNFVRKVKLGS